MTTVDVASWSKANLWTYPSGELCVRPGLRRQYAPDSGRRLVGGFTVTNSYTPEVWHYVFDVATSGTLDLRLRVLDETFQVVQIFPINCDVVPRVITSAVIEGLGLICSPDFPTLFFVVGSGVIYAEAVDSVNPATSAIPVPRGICVQWCCRVVVFDGRSMFPSDPIAATGGDPRTFVAENQNQRPGVVYGAHEGAGDSLVCVTSAGTYALASDAAAVGIVGSNGTSWRLTSSTVATSYASSCVVRGRVYALTKQGYAVVDVESDAETTLDEPLMPRAVFSRISLGDYRACRMYGTDDGPMVAHGDLDVLYRQNITNEMASWWRSSFASTDFSVRGVLKDLDGTEMLLCENGVFTVDGDFDGSIALTSAVASVTGLLFGAVEEDNAIVTSVTARAAVGGTNSTLACSVRGSRKSRAMPPDGNGFTIGVDAWTPAGSNRITTTPIKACLFEFGPARAERGSETGIEVEVVGCLNRVSTRLSREVDKQDRPQVVA